MGTSGIDGHATSAVLNAPTGLWVDSQGSVFISEDRNLRVLKVIASTNTIVLIAGAKCSVIC
jgi:secreted PhoX family phosphatase